jgi:CTP synthase
VTKYIFVTGGVCSSLGKGVAAASLASLLSARGLSVSLQKIDPYINVDPGTMSPYQHGEVYVTDDGAETDLDLGYYERFAHCRLTRLNSVSTGQVFQSVIHREREGGYLGQTVQTIPHITDEIKARIRQAARQSEADVHLVELGGTVGDIEGIPFLEAIRQFGLDMGRRNVLFIHLTLVPGVGSGDELKTKPTQHSVKELREIGIAPDILLCRSPRLLSPEMRDKIALFCNVTPEAVFTARDIGTTIYEIPVILSEQGLDDLVLKRFEIKAPEADVSDWEQIVQILREPKEEVTIGIIGKYTELHDAYKSIDEALLAGGLPHQTRVKLLRVESTLLEQPDGEEYLRRCDGVLIPGGFGTRGLEGKIAAVHYVRTQDVPFFGICLGMQCAVIEFARSVLGLDEASSTELDESTIHPVISLLSEQREVTEMGGTMRLGAYPCALVKGSRVQQAYGCDTVSERHRHRYEYNGEYREQFESHGLKVSGVYEEKDLVEIVEVENHPWFVAVQFHPEFKSRPKQPHPLFSGFIGAAVDYKRSRRRAEEAQAVGGTHPGVS